LAPSRIFTSQLPLRSLGTLCWRALEAMASSSCPGMAGLGEAQGWFGTSFAVVSLFGSSVAAWVLLVGTIAFLLNLRQVNARLRSHMATLEAKCTEHEKLRRQSVGKVAGSIGSLRARVEELTEELDEAGVQNGDSEMRVAHLHSQVNELYRVNALASVSREELAASLRSQRLSLSFSQAEKERSEEERVALLNERSAALSEIASERQVTATLRGEIQEMNMLLGEARGELARRGVELQRQSHLALPWKGDAELERYAEALGRGREGLDDMTLKRIAELLVHELPSPSSDALERQRAQRQLLTCLHPDKWPSSRVATRLMQEVQRAPSWLAIGQRGGA